MILALFMLMCALALALHRRNQVVLLQEQLLRTQKQEIDLSEEIISSHTIVTVTDPNGLLLEVNRKFEQTFGYKRDDVVGKSVSILYEDDDHDPQFHLINETLRSGGVWAGEQRLRAKSGSLILAQGTMVPIHDDHGKHIKTIGMRSDVTAVRTAEAGDYMTSLLKKLQDEIFIYRVENLSIVFMNDLALERCDWTSEEAKSKKITDTMPNFSVSAFRQHVEPVIRGEKKLVSMQARYENTFIEINTRIHVGLDEIPVFVSIVRDITQRKKIETEKLETVSIVSHELRTPLTSIKGSLRLLRSGAGGQLGPKAQTMVDVADRNSDRLLAIVNDILDYEKIKSSKMTMTFEPLELQSFLSDMIAENEGYGNEHNVSIILSPFDGDAYVMADRIRLSQVMSNLISNAIKFSPKNGKVELGVVDRDEHWRVVVADHGPGIMEKYRSTIFDGFVQARAVDGVERKGTGLGLAITKQIVVAHNGKIDFDTEIDVGTTFFFDLGKKELAERRMQEEVYASTLQIKSAREQA